MKDCHKFWFESLRNKKISLSIKQYAFRIVVLFSLRFKLAVVIDIELYFRAFGIFDMSECVSLGNLFHFNVGIFASSALVRMWLHDSPAVIICTTRHRATTVVTFG